MNLSKPLFLAGACLIAAPLRAQTGTIDQDNTTPANVVVWMQFAPFLYEQVVEVGITGVLEGFRIRVAPSQSSSPTLPVAILEWDPNAQLPTNTLWSGGAVAGPSLNMQDVFVDTSAAGLAFSQGDFFVIQVGNTTLSPNGWNLALNTGWNQTTSTPYPQYPHPLFEDMAPQSIERLVFRTYVLETIGTSFCSPAINNSTGAPAELRVLGSIVAADDNVTLQALQLPMNQFAFFLNSRMQSFVPGPNGSQGNLCLGGAIGRYNAQILNSGASGEVSLVLSLPNTPTPTGPTAILAGESWNFQCWFRDLNPGATSNFSDGVQVTWQ